MIQGVIKLLKDDSTLSGLLGDNKRGTKPKVYPGICPEPEQQPYLVLRVGSKIPLECKEIRADTHTYQFSVFAYHKVYEKLDEIQDAVEDVLSVKDPTVSEGINFQEIRFVTCNDDFEIQNSLYVRNIVFQADVDR